MSRGGDMSVGLLSRFNSLNAVNAPNAGGKSTNLLSANDNASSDVNLAAPEMKRGKQ